MMITNLLPQIAPMSFGDEQPDEVHRDTIVAVIIDSQTGMFLCQYWPEYNGLTCLLSGGVELGETIDTTVSREISEETGYRDFTVQGRLGENISMHYTKPNGERYLKNITPFLVFLNSLDCGEDAREDDEKFDNLFKDPDEIVEMMNEYEMKSGSSLDDHKEILSRSIDYLKTRK